MKIAGSIPRERRLPSLKDRAMVDVVRGVLRVRKWPKKYGKPRSALQKFWVDWFTQANRLAKYVDGITAARAIEMTKGSGLYPRDVILQAMRGRLYIWTDEEGNKWYPMAAVQNISDTLDVLAQTIGSVLVRATDRWRAPDPGNPGDVLTYQGDAAPADWQPAAGGGGFLGGALVGKSSDQTIVAWTNADITFQTEAYDTASIYDPASPTLLTVPAGFDLVRISYGMRANAGSGQVVISRVWKDANPFPGSPQIAVPASSSAIPLHNAVSPPLVVVAGEAFNLNVYNGTASTRTIDGNVDNTWFAMELLSAT